MIPLETTTGSNLKGAYETMWNSLTSAWPHLGDILTSIGAVIVAYALIKYFVQKRNGLQGGNTQHLWGSLLAALVFAIPGVIIPAFMGLADLALNFGGNIITQLANGK